MLKPPKGVRKAVKSFLGVKRRDPDKLPDRDLPHGYNNKLRESKNRFGSSLDVGRQTTSAPRDGPGAEPKLRRSASFDVNASRQQQQRHHRRQHYAEHDDEGVFDGDDVVQSDANFRGEFRRGSDVARPAPMTSLPEDGEYTQSRGIDRRLASCMDELDRLTEQLDRVTTISGQIEQLRATNQEGQTDNNCDVGSIEGGYLNTIEQAIPRKQEWNAMDQERQQHDTTWVGEAPATAGHEAGWHHGCYPHHCSSEYEQAYSVSSGYSSGSIESSPSPLVFRPTQQQHPAAQTGNLAEHFKFPPQQHADLRRASVCSTFGGSNFETYSLDSYAAPQTAYAAADEVYGAYRGPAPGNYPSYPSVGEYANVGAANYTETGSYASSEAGNYALPQHEPGVQQSSGWYPQQLQQQLAYYPEYQHAATIPTVPISYQYQYASGYGSNPQQSFGSRYGSLRDNFLDATQPTPLADAIVNTSFVNYDEHWDESGSVAGSEWSESGGESAPAPDWKAYGSFRYRNGKRVVRLPSGGAEGGKRVRFSKTVKQRNVCDDDDDVAKGDTTSTMKADDEGAVVAHQPAAARPVNTATLASEPIYEFPHGHIESSCMCGDCVLARHTSRLQPTQANYAFYS